MTGTTSSSTSPRRAAPAWLASTDRLTLLLRASLVALLVNSNDDAWTLVAVAVTCVLALPRPRLLHNPWFWGLAFVALGVRQLATWHTIDDHVFLTTYWCGALALGLTARDVLGTLAETARLLIGSLFAFAVGWKLLSGQFVDGSFFRYTLLFDDRFRWVARVVGGSTDATLESNVDAVSALLADPGTGEVLLREGPRNGTIAQIFTWWGVVVEGAVAVTFLAPLRGRWTAARHAALIAFAATTYLVVPIGGFGTVLLVLGAAMTRDRPAQTAYYLGAAGLIIWAGVWPLLFLP